MALAIDPLLYLSFLAGLIVQRWVRPPAPWIDRATLGCVFVLITLLGASLSATPTESLLAAVPISVLEAGLVLLLSGWIAHVFSSRSRVPDPPTAASGSRPLLGLVFVLAFGIGFVVGGQLVLPASTGLEIALYALLFLIGLGLRWSSARLKELWIPLTAAGSAAVVGAAVLVVGVSASWPNALATTFAFGFYSLAGPLVSSHAGATLGFIAFLSNFLRENLTMVSSPLVGRRVGADGLIAMGGATSMDTTLYFITRFGDPEAGSLAIAAGLVLTLVATVALPLLLAV